MKNILLPTDFSDNSRNAIEYALNFFKGQVCSFFFLNVQKISEFTTDKIFAASGNTSLFDAIFKDNKQKLQDLVDEFELQYGCAAYSFKSLVDYDVLTDAINQVIETKEIDLIVMGSNGATGAKEIIFGSNTLSVIRKVDSPLLVVPEDYGFNTIKSVLFTIHQQEKIDLTKLSPLLDIIKRHKTSLKILEIDEKKNISESIQGDIKKLFTNVTVESHSLKGIPTPIAVDAFVQLIDVELHATFIERKSFLERFIFGSETSKINYETRIPLLILHK